MSSDLSQVLVLTDQPLTAGAPPGYNLFLGNDTSGTYTAITDASADSSSSNLSDIGASADFSHIFFNPDIRQLTTDKVNYHDGIRPVPVVRRAAEHRQRPAERTSSPSSPPRW